jgi:tRNA threonylcarbamoyladenosine biosynthesis protein TsaB
MILTIDTALSTASVSIAKNGETIQEAINTHQTDHSAWLHVAIEKILKQSQVSINELNAIAVVAGPGSYTGLRIGMAGAKGLCYSANKPFICINTLELMTFSIIKKFKLNNTSIEPDCLFCPMLDARRMEVFTALYNKELIQKMEPCALILNEESFGNISKENQIIFFGNGSLKLKTLNLKKYVFYGDYNYTPKDVALCANEKAGLAHFTNLVYSEPWYLKEFYTPKLMLGID